MKFFILNLQSKMNILNDLVQDEILDTDYIAEIYPTISSQEFIPWFLQLDEPSRNCLIESTNLSRFRFDLLKFLFQNESSFHSKLAEQLIEKTNIISGENETIHVPDFAVEEVIEMIKSVEPKSILQFYVATEFTDENGSCIQYSSIEDTYVNAEKMARDFHHKTKNIIRDYYKIKTTISFLGDPTHTFVYKIDS